jgi:hypothetical protein
MKAKTGGAADRKIDRYDSEMAAIQPWHLALLLVILLILGGTIGAALWSVSQHATSRNGGHRNEP